MPAPCSPSSHRPPLNDTVTQVTTIGRDQLLESAKDFADRSLRAYMDSDSRVILQNAAISMEHLSKAYLASLSPVLLMEIKNGQLDSLLHLAGLGEKAKKGSTPGLSAPVKLGHESNRSFLVSRHRRMSSTTSSTCATV